MLDGWTLVRSEPSSASSASPLSSEIGGFQAAHISSPHRPGSEICGGAWSPDFISSLGDIRLLSAGTPYSEDIERLEKEDPQVLAKKKTVLVLVNF